MNSKFFLADAGNVTVPAYLALKSKGFEVNFTVSPSDPTGEVWIAKNAFAEFFAYDVVTLLGVVSVYEARGEDWRASDEEIEAFMGEFYPSSL